MNEADAHLLQLIETGDQDGWRQFVDRFQRRLIAFALHRVDSLATAEDLVQETFVSFLDARENYRGDGELESFLFQILRYRIIDHYRRSGIAQPLPVCHFGGESVIDALATAESTEPSVSWYVRRDEQNQATTVALAAAIRRLADDLQSGERFKELEIAEGLFFARRRNQELAAVMEISENEVAVVKRRLIGRLRDELRRSAERAGNWPDDALLADGLLSRVWEAERPSCPKRSTLGKYTLGILPDAWASYVDFHVQTLGCSFCRANLEELRPGSAAGENAAARDRLVQSTIGFFRAHVGV
ncbi:RNA polymerase sigma factor [Stieleria maiorica]|uniref:RNA polymerase sigma factor n=1 Tax=Stieleria maiorica TaxID=2795974 RepID=A0A5B9MEK2_9BACT|nr:sigma-70 family RNA polymerase sigma factor [Stieleria maiorica]QEF97945.1 RNA polymerase sigma factor [Stieleria maiorica]